MALDKSKKYKALSCCGIGQATSVLLAKNVRKAFEEIGIQGTCESTQVSAGASQGKNYDMIFCNRNLVSNFDEAAKQGCMIIGVKNIMSVSEVKQAMLNALQENE